MTPKPFGAEALVAHRWGDLPERGTPASLRLIAWIAVHVGRWTTRLLLYPVTLYFVISAREARRVSYEYLRRVRGRPAHWWHVFLHFYCFAATILDRLYLLRGEFEHFDVTLHEKEILLRKIESGKGCILLGSHLGSFEVLRALGVTQQNFPLKVLMDTAHNQNITRFLDSLNEKIASTVIVPDRPDTLLRVKESLDAGFLDWHVRRPRIERRQDNAMSVLGCAGYISGRSHPACRYYALPGYLVFRSLPRREALRNLFRAFCRGDHFASRSSHGRRSALDATLCRAVRVLRAPCAL